MQQEFIFAGIYLSRTNGYPQYYNLDYSSTGFVGTPIKKARINDWDCACYDLSFLKGHNNGKIRIAFGNNYTVPPIAIDNLYIGIPKPDISIQRNQEFITTTAQTRDTLHYRLFNNGMSVLPSTVTRFYWSTDTVLDATDILLGIKTESPLIDTVFTNTSFAFNKPTTAAGNYYLLYKADASQAVNEMWENNNEGYFEVVQRRVIATPYFNNFESDVSEWYISASLGKQQSWQWDTPTGNAQEQSFSGRKSWVSGGYEGTVKYNQQFNRCHLYTPVFDLSHLEHPVIQFDWQNYWDESKDYVFTNYNISYSLNGGFTWTVLDTASQSQKGFYYGMGYDRYNGTDYYGNSTYAFDYLTGEKSFINNHKLKPIYRTTAYDQNGSYQGRDSDRDTHFVLDIGFLKGKKNIQFRFNYISGDGDTHISQGTGAIMDNFSIAEHYTDLTVGYHKNLQISPLTDTLRFFMHIKNQGNYIAAPSKYHFYLSSDTIFSANDYKLTSDSAYLPLVRPDMSHYLQTQFALPTGWSEQYKYLIYQLDAGQKINEANERNNLGYWTLGAEQPLSIPYFDDFEKEYIDGWTWYPSIKNNGYDFRFRHKVVNGEPTFNTNSGQWFLDLFEPYHYISFYPSIYYLESPAFDFKNISTGLRLSFDFICVGNTLAGTGDTGGNIQYSTDGGKSWKVLGRAWDENGDLDSLGTNWYTYQNIAALNQQAGWAAQLPGQSESEFNTAAYDITFLRGEPSVQFRFQFRSTAQYGHFTSHGFRLDNFRIEAAAPILLSQTINFEDISNITHGDSALVLKATASSQLPVQFEVVSGNAITNGNMLTTTGAGSVTVRATQTGNVNYHPAMPVEKTFAVARATQAIQILPIADKIVGDTPFRIPVVKGKSKKPINFSIIYSSEKSVSALLKDDTLTPTEVGLVTIQATQEGDDNYEDAPAVETTFCVRPAKPMIKVEFNAIDSLFILTSASDSYLKHQWFFNGVLIPDSDMDTWFTDQSGSYQVQVTGPCGIPQISDIFNVNITVVEDVLAAQIKIYPNPADDNLLLILPKNLIINKITVINSKGQSLQQYEGNFSQKISLNLEKMPIGFYLLRIETAQGMTNKKFIIVR